MSTSPYPVRLTADDDLSRSRVTVFFRALLVIPHWIVLSLYGFVVFFVVVIAWFAALFTGRVPSGLHDFIAGYLRYSMRVTAYWFILANPFPPFGGGGTYPVDLEVDPPAQQGRVGVFFRTLLAYPCFFLLGALNLALNFVAIGCWFVALFMGRVPPGLNALGLYCLRFSARVNGYFLLVTSRYPALGDPGAPLPPVSAPASGYQGSLPPDQGSLPPIP